MVNKQTTEQRESLLPEDYYEDSGHFRVNRPLRATIKPLLFAGVALWHGRTVVSPPNDPDRIPKKVIIIAPHRSWEDIPRTVASAEEIGVIGTRFVFKADFFKHNYIGRTFEMLGGVAVDRARPNVAGLNAIMGGLLLSGNSIAYYLEGTRRNGGDCRRLGELKAGAAILAVEHNVPILPLGIAGLGKQDKRRPMGGGLPIVTSFGEPIYPVADGPLSYKSPDGIEAVQILQTSIAEQLQAELDNAYFIRDNS